MIPSLLAIKFARTDYKDSDPNYFNGIWIIVQNFTQYDKPLVNQNQVHLAYCLITFSLTKREQGWNAHLHSVTSIE